MDLGKLCTKKSALSVFTSSGMNMLLILHILLITEVLPRYELRKALTRHISNMIV